ncbi:hypothetical protein GCM10020218_039410 [Dactylosporangium vinaceum]|uniref:Uncharacterized protein n=1 Tax=Dactylosporangium vinaceum TaxID=53362 RepID=A0ABV5MNT7_9ACTN|nr:hypothetical protein [Dactylosporangium vinaceum]
MRWPAAGPARRGGAGRGGRAQQRCRPVGGPGVDLGAPAGKPCAAGRAGAAEFLDDVGNRAAADDDVLDEQAAFRWAIVTSGSVKRRSSTSPEVFLLIKLARRVDNARDHYTWPRVTAPSRALSGRHAEPHSSARPAAARPV